jgi:succinate-semialdehyde dehydrogenase/glutarate-semialdehyde dehydrogenase
VVVGGGPLGGPGSFFAPTVLSDVPRDAALMHDEIFGPVAPVTTFVDEDDAVRLANDTPYGLVAYLYTTDLARGHRLLGRLRVGMLGGNTGLVSNAAAPFGGVGQSGIGREGGREGIHEYLDTTYALVPNG